MFGLPIIGRACLHKPHTDNANEAIAGMLAQQIRIELAGTKGGVNNFGLNTN